MDEEQSEMTLGFWYLFQEALWSTDYNLDEGDEVPTLESKEEGQWAVARAVYGELVKVLRRKVVWPGSAQTSWAKGELEFRF